MGTLRGILLILGFVIFPAQASEGRSSIHAPPSTELRVLAASSVAQVGVIDALARDFENRHPGIKVRSDAAGAIEVLDRARRGQADLVITHHKRSEEVFMAEGLGARRALLMHNQFAIVGPSNDPLGLSDLSDMRGALQRLAEQQEPFLVPGNRSGTASVLNDLWVVAGVEPNWPGYEVTHSSSATTLLTADAMGAHAFVDMGTYLVNRAQLGNGLKPLFRDSIALRNDYSAMVVNAARVTGVRQDLAETFFSYLISDDAQALIANFGVDRFGMQIYTPAAYLDTGLREQRARRELEQKTRQLWLLASVALILTVAIGIISLMFWRARRLERMHFVSEERFRVAVAGTNDGIWDWHPAEQRTYVSPRFCAILGIEIPAEDYFDPIATWLDRIDIDQREPMTAAMANYLSSRPAGGFELECRVRRDAGEPVWVSMRGSAQWNSQAELVRMSGSISDISHRKQQELELERFAHQATHDALTGLPNRRYLLDHLRRIVQDAGTQGESVSILLMDLDGFKDINDRLGHQVGDGVLQEVARRLGAVLRDSDVVARLGGDEFAMVLPSTERKNVQPVIDKILSVFQSELVQNGHRLEVGISIGIATYPDQGHDISRLLNLADQDMYQSKHSRPKRRRIGRSPQG